LSSAVEGAVRGQHRYGNGIGWSMVAVVVGIEGMGSFQNTCSGEFDDGSVVIRSAYVRGGVEQAVRSLDQTENADSGGGLAEGENHAVYAGAGELVNGRGITGIGSARGGAVEVAVRGLDGRAVGIFPVAATGKAVQDGDGAGCGDGVEHAEVVGASHDGGAVVVAAGGQGEASAGITAVGAVKAVQDDAVVGAQVDFDDGTQAVGATVVGSAVEASSRPCTNVM